MDDCMYALVTVLVKGISLRWAQEGKSWQALVKTVMNLRVP